MWTWLLASIALGACPDDPVAEVRQQTSAMEVAFVELDDPGFDAARDAVEAALPCVTDPLALRDILGLHRAMALAAFIDGDMVASKKSWGTVRVLHPSWEPPEAIAPEGHMLRDLFVDAPTDTEVVTLDLAPEGGWLVDGRATSDVPANRAFVLQALGEQGVFHTGYHRSVAAVPVRELVQPGPSPRTKRMRKTGTIVASGLAAGALAGLGVNLYARNELGSVDYDKVAATRTAGDVGGVGAIVLGAGAVGVASVAWGVRW